MTTGRRTARRNQTIAEILDVAIEVMTEGGVGGLSLSEVARRMGMRPPSLYKYFPSRLALYDTLFREGQRAYLERFRTAAAGARPGVPALAAALEAGARWALTNRALAQLMFWRPVPGFEPSAEAFAPSIAMVSDVRQMLRDAVAEGQLRPQAASADGEALLSILAAGVMSQQLANQPEATYDEGRFTRLGPQILAMFTHHYAPTEVDRADRQPRRRPDRAADPRPGRGRH
jgi:AcrR family transcriptional regulator